MSVAPPGGQDRIMIYGPKSDGTYIIEFRMADGESLASRREPGRGANEGCPGRGMTACSLCKRHPVDVARSRSRIESASETA